MNTTTVHHPIFARLYPQMGKAMDRGGMTQRRQTLLAGLTGQVIEVGAGDGLNFGHYPPTTTHVLAVEPEPHLRSLARDTARHAPVPVEVVDGLAQQLPAADGSADAVVVSLVLCSLPNQDTGWRSVGQRKRPRSSMSPTIVLAGGKPFLALDSPGGATIITTVPQMLVNRIDLGMTLPEAMAAPRA